MKTDDNRCRECGTKLHGKNAIDVGYCVPCYNMMMADPDDDDYPHGASNWDKPDPGDLTEYHECHNDD